MNRCRALNAACSYSSGLEASSFTDPTPRIHAPLWIHRCIHRAQGPWAMSGLRARVARPPLPWHAVCVAALSMRGIGRLGAYVSPATPKSSPVQSSPVQSSPVQSSRESREPLLLRLPGQVKSSQVESGQAKSPLPTSIEGSLRVPPSSTTCKTSAAGLSATLVTAHIAAALLALLLASLTRSWVWRPRLPARAVS